MKTALCIVDMQYSFMDTAENALEGVLKEIKLARRRNAPVFILEYAGCGKTVKPIWDALKGYKHVYRPSRKNTDGGGRELLRCVEKNGVDARRIRMCGVNRSYCVGSTLADIHSHNKHIRLETSVSGSWCYDPQSGLEVCSYFGRLVN